MREGWETKTIGDSAVVIAGQSPDGSFYNYSGNGLPFYQGKKDFGERFIAAPTAWTTQITKVALAGDVLMSVRAPVGPVNFATQKSCIGRGLAAIRAGRTLDKDFLFFFLLSKQSEISGTEGAVFASISKRDIENIEIPLPPLPEQQRIVAILDEAFEGIAKAKANAEKNLQNARAVFDSHLNEVFSRRGEGWEEKRLGDLFDITSSKRVFESDWKSEGVPFYRAREIVKLAKHGFVDNQLFISETMFNQYSAKYGIPCEGDIMVTGVGTLGICYVVQKDDRFYFKDGNIIWLKKRTKVDSRFIEYSFRSDFLRKQIDDSVGATVGTFTIIKAKNTVVPVPPLPEQRRIIEQLDLLRSETQRLEAIYRRKVAALDELKRSLLNQAFNGEL